MDGSRQNFMEITPVLQHFIPKTTKIIKKCYYYKYKKAPASHPAKEISKHTRLDYLDYQSQTQ